MGHPVSTSAFYCTGVRMLDAQSAHPSWATHWAARFMDDEERAFFEEPSGVAIPNASKIRTS